MHAALVGMRATCPDRALPGVRHSPERRPVVGVSEVHLSTPVTTTPRMNARWARKKTTTGTAIVISAVAWMSVGWVEYSALYCWMPTDSGWSAGLLPRYRSGRKKSFQAKKKWNRLTATMAGIDSGTMIERRTRNGLAPSIIAASSRSRGRDMKYWRSRKTL